MKRPGLALLLVVGVLGILAILSVAFVTLARLERRASQQRLHASKALLLARSGLEDALARLSAGQDPEAASNRYGGEDWLMDGDQGPGSFDQLQEVYGPGKLDVEACPARHALRPSFFTTDALGRPEIGPVEGRQRGRTGALAEGQFVLKVSDPGIYVNGGDPAAAAAVGYNAVLRRILGNLAEAIDREDGLDDGLPTDETIGWALVDFRPVSGWKDLDAIKALAVQAGLLTQVEPILPYLTTRAWVDRKVIRPNADMVAVSTMNIGVKVEPVVESWAAIKLAHETYPATPGIHAPDFERIPVAPGGKIVGRAPVDLSWARHHRPVLIALIAGLKGVYLDETVGETRADVTVVIPFSTWPGRDVVGAMREVEIPWAEAEGIADQILASPTEIRTWADWDAFCDAMAVSPANSWGALPDWFGGEGWWQLEALKQAKRDLLKVAFNPNTDLNKFNPDRSMARLLDKSDLLVYSTEFNLTPRAGGRIESVGRVTDASGRLLASRRLSAEMAPWDLLRLTTQREFAAGDLGSLDLAGDEAGLRTYGAPDYLSEAVGAERAFGHKLALGGFLNGASGGVSLQTGPEPHGVTPADYDGQVRLATVETGTEAGMKFLARWEDTLDASPGSGNPAAVWDSGMPPAATPLWAGAPGMLYPDGIYLERDRQPGYYAAGNMAPQRGAISLWYKPNADERAAILTTPWPSNRRHALFNDSRLIQPGAAFSDPNTAMFFLCQATWNAQVYPDGFGIQVESGFSGDLPSALSASEQMRYTPQRDVEVHRWHLVTAFWDMGQTLWADSLGLWVDLGSVPNDQGNGIGNNAYKKTLAIVPGIDFTQPDGYSVGAPGSPAVFYLGQRGDTLCELNGYKDNFCAPDATLDELLISDLGGGGVGKLAAQQLAQERFRSGRFYKESGYGGLAAAGNTAATYLSAPMDLGRVRLKGLAWTQVVPRGLRSPLPAGGQTGVDGDPGPDGAISLELTDASGGGYLQDVSGLPLNFFWSNAGFSRVDRLVIAPFRLHAVFQPNLDNAADTPVLDPLVLDDVTLLYGPAEGARLLAWGTDPDY